MISYYLIHAVLISITMAGVLLPANPGPAYSSSVFSQTFARQEEPARYLARIATNAAPIAYVDAENLTPISAASFVNPGPRYVTQTASVVDAMPQFATKTPSILSTQPQYLTQAAPIIDGTPQYLAKSSILSPLKQYVAQTAPVVDNVPQYVTKTTSVADAPPQFGQQKTIIKDADPAYLTKAAPIADAVPQFLAQIPAPSIASNLAPVTSYTQYFTGYSASSPNVANVQQPDYKELIPKYEYAYLVIDPQTGDHKSQQESRNGDVVRGEYSLIQPDGSVRRVAYTADDLTGFNAVIRNYAPTTITADPCVIEATNSANGEPLPSTPKDCVNCKNELLGSIIPGNSNKGVGSRGALVDTDKSDKGFGGQPTNSGSSRGVFSDQPGLVQEANKNQDEGPIIQTLRKSGNISQLNNNVKSNSKAGRKEITISYDDIVRCAIEEARTSYERTRGNSDNLKPVSQTKEADLYAVPSPRPTLAYVATPFIFPVTGP